MKRISNCISVLHRFSMLHYNRFTDQTGLTGTQYLLLPYVCHHEGCRQDDLSVHLHINKSSVTRQIDKLEAAGLIEIRPDVTDGRARCVFPTEKAKELFPQVQKIKEEWNDSMTQTLTAAEKETLLALLNKVLENVKEMEKRP